MIFANPKKKYLQVANGNVVGVTGQMLSGFSTFTRGKSAVIFENGDLVYDLRLIDFFEVTYKYNVIFAQIPLRFHYI